MKPRHLILFEGAAWRSLRPLTDLLPVPALAFGSSSLGARWMRAVGAPLLAIEARSDVLAAWAEAPATSASRPDVTDLVWAVDAALLPGAWGEAALRDGERGRFTLGGRIVAVCATFAELAPGLGRGPEFAGFLASLDLPDRAVPARAVEFPWQLVEWNAEAITEDLAGFEGVQGEVHALAALIEPGAITVEAGARVDPFAVLDARGGPIWIGPRAQVLAHTVVTGPCAVGAGTQLLGGFVGRSTFGPECRVAGEVEECVWQGYGNKRHHGFLGHSVVSEWVNLGALTTTSDLKNNYGPVRAWCDGREVDTGTNKLGSIIGAHVKTGIGSLLPTGCVVGAGANLFGGGRFAPKNVGSFAWWDGEHTIEHRLDAFLKTARIAMGRRGRSMSAADEALLAALHRATAGERAG